MFKRLSIAIVILMIFVSPVFGKNDQYARVSWYHYGKITANGEKFNPNVCTVAHKSLPFGTLVYFYNPNTQSSIIARINDRGPYIKGREFDISRACAIRLGMKEVGVVKLKIKIIKV